MAQTARSVRILYSAYHLGKFGLSVDFHHTNLDIRFLTFYSGGVMASKHLSVVKEQGKKDIPRAFISVLVWRPEEDAGIFDPFHNGPNLDIFI